MFRPSMQNVVSTGTQMAKIGLSLSLIGYVRFARYSDQLVIQYYM